MILSILFWNIWLDNQTQTPERFDSLKQELSRLIDTYKPDVLCLNEVVTPKDVDVPPILAFLKEQGYTDSHYAIASPIDNQFMIGTAVCSKIPVQDFGEIAICQDTAAERRGYNGYEVKSVEATVNPTAKLPIHIIAAHPLHLRDYTIKAHYQATQTLENVIRNDEHHQNTILGGDFNEPGFMPNAFKRRVADSMHFRTGTKMRPTWRHNTYPLTPIRANLDQLYWSKDAAFELSHFEVIRTKVSDHLPLFASFELPD